MAANLLSRAISHDHVIPCLIGRDAHQIEDIWQYLYRGAYWRRGPVTMSAIAAVDTALWDLKAKAAGMPLYQLLGGASRERVLVYGHANGADIASTVDEVLRYKAVGYQAIRAQSGVPGLAKVYGVGRGSMQYEPAEVGLPSEHDWDTSKYLHHTPKLFDAVRRAVGEVFNTIWDCKALIENQLIDFIRTTVVHAGGITHLRRIADLASLYQVRTGSHGATDLSPVCMGAALHFDLWVPNFGIQEYMRHSDQTDAVFPHAYTFRDGFMHPGEVPGHGVTIDEALAAKYPYQRAYLPVNRLQHDGTLWNW